MTSPIDTAVKVTPHSLVLGEKKKNKCLGDGEMTRNRKCLESNGLFSPTAHIPLHKCFAMPSSSPPISEFQSFLCISERTYSPKVYVEVAFLRMWHGKKGVTFYLPISFQTTVVFIES